MDINVKYVLPIIYIDIRGQSKLEVYWTQFDHFTFASITHKIERLTELVFGTLAIIVIEITTLIMASFKLFGCNLIY